MNKRMRFAAVAGVVALGGLGVTLGWAAGDDSNQINACTDKGGNVRVLAANESCRPRESPLSWSITGPQGPAGPQGAQGIQGPPGPTLTANTITVIGQVSVKAQQQGQIPGGDGTKVMIDVTKFTEGVISPRDAASGLPTGKRQHKPLTITKEIDAASPRLYRACTTNENLPEVVLNLYAPGGNTPKTTVKLTNASCASLQHDDQYETVSFTFQKITWTYIDGGITAEDDWEAPVA